SPVENALQSEREAECVSHFAIVETERLFVEVAEQMERFDGNVGALDGALQETPEVLKAVSVDRAVHVGFGMVNDLVNVAALSHTVIGAQGIGVEARAIFDVLRDDGFQLMFLPIGDDLEAHSRAAVVLPVTFQESHHGDLANHGTALRDAKPTT